VNDVTALVSTLTSLPFTQLRRNRHFYLWYDGFFMALALVLLAVMKGVGHRPLLTHWDNVYLLAFPLACHVQILCSVCIHNCTHGNFPRPINRIIGEICGLVVLTRFASWEVVHQRHHRYTDDRDKDPHPVMNGYWGFLVRGIIGVEKQLQRIYFDLYGDTPENRAYQKYRATLSFATMVAVGYTWFVFLGPIAFWAFFAPASILGVLHLMHFNWSTHNGFSPTQDFRPVNLDHGFYWIGNRIWFGIYMHANHHKRANLFNPSRMTPSLPIEPAA
jgi:stearoyl-CoA desaturase (delta-9 desaturase)